MEKKQEVILTEKEEGIFGLDLKYFQKHYQLLQNQADGIIKNEFFKNNDLFLKISHVAESDGLIEIGHAFGDGDDGSGYYEVHLILNLNSSPSVYLVQKYVPMPDNTHEWDIKDFSELEELKFSKILSLLVYLKIFTKPETCWRELSRLAERQCSTCVNTVKAGGLSFV